MCKLQAKAIQLQVLMRDKIYIYICNILDAQTAQAVEKTDYGLKKTFIEAVIH